MNEVTCPKCGCRFHLPQKVRRGDWIKDKQRYDNFFKDKSPLVRLSIEDYLILKDLDLKKYTLQFTTTHNNAKWEEVKKAFQELRVSDFIHESYCL